MGFSRIHRSRFPRILLDYSHREIRKPLHEELLRYLRTSRRQHSRGCLQLLRRLWHLDRASRNFPLGAPLPAVGRWHSDSAAHRCSEYHCSRMCSGMSLRRPYRYLQAKLAFQDLTATSDVSRQPVEGPLFNSRIAGGVLADGVNSLVC